MPNSSLLAKASMGYYKLEKYMREWRGNSKRKNDETDREDPSDSLIVARGKRQEKCSD